MRCKYHDDSPAVASCDRCRAPLCDACTLKHAVYGRTFRYCPECFDRRHELAETPTMQARLRSVGAYLRLGLYLAFFFACVAATGWWFREHNADSLTIAVVLLVEIVAIIVLTPILIQRILFEREE